VAAVIVPLGVAMAVVGKAVTAVAPVTPEALWRGRRGQQRRGHRGQRSRGGHGGRAVAVAAR
jgi:hypothetical protein